MKENRSFPQRPFLTPLFTTSLLFWGSCALTFSLSKGSTPQVSLAIALAGVALCLLLSLYGVKNKKAFAILACSALVAGAALASAEAYLLHSWTQAGAMLGLDQARVTLLQDPSDVGYAPQALSRVETKGGKSVLALVSFPKGDDYLCGQTLVVSGSIKKADYGKSDFAWRNGATHLATVTAVREFVEVPVLSPLIAFRSKALESIGNADADCSLLQALVCGYRANIKDTPLYASYQSDGLAHLVAVSGAHLVIVAGFAYLLLRFLRIPKRMTVGLLVVLMCLYVVVAGVPLSALRAAIMSSFGVLSYVAKRRPSSLNALGAGIYAIVGTCPHAALSASLALSALSAMGIIVFAPLLQREIELVLPMRIRFAAAPLALTFSAALPAQMYSCALFSQLSLISPLSNLVCTPLFPFCCGLGLLGALASCAGLPFGFAILEIAHLGAKLLDSVVALLDRIPYGAVPISIDGMSALALSFAVCAMMWLLWEKAFEGKAMASVFAVGALTILFVVFGPKADCIAMLDVGQGDSFLLRSRGATLLIDTGNKDTQLLDQLARLGVFHLDGVLVTHSDDDHCGSLDALSRAVDVDTVFFAQDMLTCEEDSCVQVVAQAHRLARRVAGLSAGDSLDIGKFTAEVLWPHSFVDDGGNADSLVLDVRYDADCDGVSDLDALFTGDAEHEQIEAMVREGALGKVDILKVGHHGSANALTEEQALLLDPSIALIGVGKGNSYGHPSHEILALLDEVGAEVLRSDEDGGVMLSLGKGEVVAKGF